MGSKPFSFDSADFLKTLKLSGFVGAGAALTYLAQNLVNVDMGPAIAAVVPLVTTALFAAATWFNDNSKNEK